MSDRPMRLKYLTKMKIILCIFLLCITAVSVFGEPQELNGILGGSIEFPAAVKIEGNLIYSGATIGDVTGGRFTRARSKFSSRLQWESSTGLFSISGLRLEDSGVFTVQNSDEPRSVSTFSLTVKAVVGQLVELNGILGESVKFPAAVKIKGILMHSGLIIGEVTAGRFMPPRNGGYSSRVHWDSSTGLFSLSGLKMEDIGEYKVQNTDPNNRNIYNIITVFQLNVYKDNVPVSKPNVLIHYESCTIECTAERGTGATLSWYREGETNPYITSPVHSHPDLHLPVPVEGSGTYTCEAKNSVSSETSDPLSVGDHCTVNVSKPHVSITHDKYPCTLLCTVERGTGVTLTLYENGEKNPYVTSPVESAPNLHLPQTVESGTYTCEAKNSVSRETSDPLPVGAHCTGPSAGTIVAIIIAVVAVANAVVLAVLYRRTRGILQGIRSKRPGEDMLVLTPHEEEMQASPPDGLLGLSKGKNELGIEEEDPTHLRDDLS